MDSANRSSQQRKTEVVFNGAGRNCFKEAGQFLFYGSALLIDCIYGRNSVLPEFAENITAAFKDCRELPSKLENIFRDS